jgi:hemophore-related protein
MVLSGSTVRRMAAGMIATGAMLFGAMSLAYAQPTPSPEPAPPSAAPGCTAGDLAQVSSGVASATADYLFSHPQVNDFFTSLRGRPNDELPGEIRSYMDANPQVRAELTAIRQPLVDLRARCEVPAPPM